jgi:hypothetical protein
VPKRLHETRWTAGGYQNPNAAKPRHHGGRERR